MSLATTLHRTSLTICLALATAACSKKPHITGIVKNNFGQPVGGVSVSVEGTTFKTMTDASGHYELGYVPGAVVVRYENSGYISDRKTFQIATATQFPAEDATLKKLPPGNGLFYVGSNDYVVIPKGHLRKTKTPCEGHTLDRLFCNAAADEGYELSFFADGDFTKFDENAGGGQYGFLDGDGFRNKDVYRLDQGSRIYHRLFDMNSRTGYGNYFAYSQAPIIGHSASEWHEGIQLRTMSLVAGRYVIAARGRKTMQEPIGPPAEPAYLIQVGP